jgi:alpha-tubulin suppressor-like RCC1 family protein
VKGRWWIVLLAACGEGRGSMMTIDAATQGDAPDTSKCAVEIAAAGDHTCVRKSDYSVWCWGRSYSGDNGIDSTLSELCVAGGLKYACDKVPVKVMLTVPATGLGIGHGHSCAITGPTTWCWGQNGGGQFGNGAGYSSHIPQFIVERGYSTKLVAGPASTCSIIGGDAACSGFNNAGEVGNGTTTVVYTPFKAQLGVQNIAMGNVNTCAVSNNTVSCWGDNTYQQIDATGMPHYTPTFVPSAPAADEVAIGEGHVCSRNASGDVTCWGSNMRGQLGIGSAGVAPQPPTPVAITGVVQLVAGGKHTCARLASGEVRCWGDWFNSPLMTSPTTIALPMPATSLAAGNDHDCAILSDGSVWCWGWNPYSQLGNGTSSEVVSATPVRSNVCP